LPKLINLPTFQLTLFKDPDHPILNCWDNGNGSLEDVDSLNWAKRDAAQMAGVFRMIQDLTGI